MTACSAGGDPQRSSTTGGGSPSPPPPTGASLVSCKSFSSDIVAADAHNSGDIAALNALAPANTGVKAQRSGAWSDPGVWGGSVPASGAVVIPAGVGVIVDSRLSSAIGSVRVDGCLEFAIDRDTRLRTDLLFVAPGGELWIGSGSAPIAPGVVAEIAFPPNGPMNAARDPNLLGRGLVSASKTTIVGAKKTSRVRAAVAPLKGATKIALESAPTGWRVGDRLVLTGTRWVKFFDVGGVRSDKGHQNEVLTLTAINGSSVTVSPALNFDHDGPRAEFTPYLVNFSRNVRLYTESGATTPASERGHGMFMSPQTVIRSAEFKDMGRTDKSVRAFSASALKTVTSSSNLKGRYPVHLHKAGDHDSPHATDVRNVAIWGSPGWGVAQHSGRTMLYDNAVYDAFGAGFVAESGDEQGAWVSNIAIKSVGVPEIVKDGASVAAFDLARTGDGFWLQGRLLHLHENVAAGMGGGIGFVYMNRSSDIADPEPIEPGMLLQPASFRNVNQKIEHPNIQQFTDNEAFACRTGFHVVKYSPRQPHDSRTVIDHFTAWEVETGIQLTYVSDYIVKNATLIGSRDRPALRGVEFGTNTFDLAVVDSRIEDFETGVDFFHHWTTNFATAAFYVSVNNTFRNISGAVHRNVRANDLIMPGQAPITTPSVSFGWGSSIPMWGGANNFRSLVVSGVKTDPAGAVPFPLVSGLYVHDDKSVKALLAGYGYYTLPDGRRVASALEHFSSRTTGEIELTSFLFEIDPGFSLAGFSYNGVLNLSAPAPAAAADAAIVQRNSSTTMDVLANDSTGAPFTVAGMTPARNGLAQVESSGNIRYTPYPDFTGKDSFSYWSRSKDGRIDKALVTITVQ